MTVTPRADMLALNSERILADFSEIEAQTAGAFAIRFDTPSAHIFLREWRPPLVSQSESVVAASISCRGRIAVKQEQGSAQGS